MNQRILSLILIYVLLPSCITKNNIIEPNTTNPILSQITSHISITYKKDGTFINYTCDTTITQQEVNKNYEAIKQKCISKITQLFTNNKSREHLKSQIMETISTVSMNNETENLQEIVTNLLRNMIAKSSANFKNISIIKKNRARNAPVFISFSY